jgi:hypothetical protein
LEQSGEGVKVKNQRENDHEIVEYGFSMMAVRDPPTFLSSVNSMFSRSAGSILTIRVAEVEVLQGEAVDLCRQRLMKSKEAGSQYS